MSDNNVLVRHSRNNDHQINWKEASMLYKSNNVGNRRLVEGAFINIGNSMEGNKSFTQEDLFTNSIIHSMVIKAPKTQIDSHQNTDPDAAASLSPAQVTGLHRSSPVAGTYADADGPADSQQNPRGARRSRRLAGLPADEGIT